MDFLIKPKYNSKFKQNHKNKVVLKSSKTENKKIQTKKNPKKNKKIIEIKEKMAIKVDKIVPEVTGKNLNLYNRVGVVVAVTNGIAKVTGLQSIAAGELVYTVNASKNKVFGLGLNLEKKFVNIIVLAGSRSVKVGDSVFKTNSVMRTVVGSSILGRIVDCFGYPLNPLHRASYKPTNFEAVESKAPGVLLRQRVVEPLLTGILSIDTMIPLGRGQRELIIGDRQTGKTAIAVDAILNQKFNFNKSDTNLQKNNFIYCIYVAIGQKLSTVFKIFKKLKKENAMSFTSIVAAAASEAASLQFIAPYAATSMAEYFRNRGAHALIIYDDLSKQAVAYRQISLLLRRPPGREAYPGDVFYLHSRLLERAAKLSDNVGGGSLTALPVVETQAGDVSAYIPTNVISITDGQIFLDSKLFHKGVRPAINAGLSVSRIGAAAQYKLFRAVAPSLKISLAQFKEVEFFVSFGPELDAATAFTVNRGLRLVELLKQNQYRPYSVYLQVILVYSGISGFLDIVPLNLIKDYKEYLFAELVKTPDWLKYLNLDLNSSELDQDTKDRLDKCLLTIYLDFEKNSKN
jgi:F-type H+-transporting ATPase subunit alpha